MHNENTSKSEIITSIYIFCLEWQMRYYSQEKLKEDFIKSCWDFNEFKSIAKKYDWYVSSMEILNSNKS